MTMKIAIYFTEEGTLGHSTRVLSIAGYLKRMNHDVLVLQGGMHESSITKKGIDIHNVPHPFHSKKTFFSGKFVMDSGKIKKRIAFMGKALSDFRPDILITEYFPLGRIEEKYEIVPLIKLLKNKNPNIRIYCSMGYPSFDFGLSKEITKYSALYDGIFIHTPRSDVKYLKREMEPGENREYNKIMNKLQEKIFFTGYIIENDIGKDSEEIREELDLDDKKFVLVSRGGGIMYPKIITSSALSSKYLKDFFFLISCGIFSTPKELEIFKRVVKKYENIKLVRHLPGFIKYLNACDISISMSGYNTSVETLWVKKRSILIPKKIGIEQIYRAKMLKDLIGSSVIDYRRISPKKLAKCIEYQSDNEFGTKIDQKSFKGLDSFYKVALDYR